MITTDVVNFSILDVCPDLGRLKVLQLVVVGGGKVSDHGPVMAGNDNTAAASGLILLDAIFCENSLLHTRTSEGLAKGILTNTSDVDRRLRREHILSPIYSLAFAPQLHITRFLVT